MAIQEIKVPDIGSFKDVGIIEVFVRPGDSVSVEQALITLETDKAAMDVPSPHAGLVKEVKVKVGDKVSEGTVILLMDVQTVPLAVETPIVPNIISPSSQVSQTVTVQGSSFTVAPDPRQPSLPTASLPSVHLLPSAYAGPAVRHLARQLGVALNKVKGSGRKGRVLKEDVHAFVKQIMIEGNVPLLGIGLTGGGMGIPPLPEIDFSIFGEIEMRPLSRIKKLSGASVYRSWLNVPQVTQFDEADITELEQFRKNLAQENPKHTMKITVLAFLLKAASAALKQFPEFNSSLDKENLVVKKYYHIGVAVETPQGLVVPVIRDVNLKGLFDLATELGVLSQKAREGKLSPHDLQGASFTISSLGGIGGTGFTPIVNAPEVAILGISRSQIRPVYKEEQFVPRLILPFSVSYDHRVIDGAQAARFTSYLSFILSDVRRLLL